MQIRGPRVYTIALDCFKSLSQPVSSVSVKGSHIQMMIYVGSDIFAAVVESPHC